jgi:hypothetical protein
MQKWSKEDSRCIPLAEIILSIARNRKSYGARPGDVRYFIDRPLLDHPLTHQRDGIKYSVRHHMHTRAARGTHKGLLHLEHAVPVSVLWNSVCQLSDRGASGNEVVDFLSRACRVAIMTRVEHAGFARIGLKDRMPPGWDPFDGGVDPWARYRVAGVELLSPIDYSIL